jgi:hypothetical protein
MLYAKNFCTFFLIVIEKFLSLKLYTKKMSNTMTLLALVTNKTTTKSCIDGTAVYRANPKKFKYFEFKLFIESNTDIHTIEEGNLVMFSGKFTYRKDQETNPMFVCLQLIIN